MLEFDPQLGSTSMAQRKTVSQPSRLRFENILGTQTVEETWQVLGEFINFLVRAYYKRRLWESTRIDPAEIARFQWDKGRVARPAYALWVGEFDDG